MIENTNTLIATSYFLNSRGRGLRLGQILSKFLLSLYQKGDYNFSLFNVCKCEIRKEKNLKG